MEDNKEAMIVDTPTEASSIKKEEPTVKSVPVEQLPNEWYNTIPALVSDAQIKAKGLIYVYGSKNLTKIVTFLKATKILKSDIDYWMNNEKFPAKRNDDELYEDYKVRQKFQNALLKYRKEVSAFSIMYTLQDFIEQQKAKKADEAVNQIKEQNKELNTTLESVKK